MPRETNRFLVDEVDEALTGYPLEFSSDRYRAVSERAHTYCALMGVEIYESIGGIWKYRFKGKECNSVWVHPDRAAVAFCIEKELDLNV